MKVLAIDVENRIIRFGLFDGETLIDRWVVTAIARTADEMATGLVPRFAAHDIDRVVMSSVVPWLTPSVREVATRITDQVLVVGPGVKTGLQIGVDNPRDLGTDRVVGAVAGVEAYGAPVVVVDFRTATTIDVVDERRTFRGGVIAPGLAVSAEALAAVAAGLRHVELQPPPRVVGRNTTEAIQAGIVVGTGAMVEGVLHRIETELGIERVTVVATGEPAPIVAQVTSRIDFVDLDLTLRGLRIIAELNPI